MCHQILGHSTIFLYDSYQNASVIMASVFVLGTVFDSVRFAVQLIATISAVSVGIASPTFWDTFTIVAPGNIQLQV